MLTRATIDDKKKMQSQSTAVETNGAAAHAHNGVEKKRHHTKPRKRRSRRWNSNGSVATSSEGGGGDDDSGSVLSGSTLTGSELSYDASGVGTPVHVAAPIDEAALMAFLQNRPPIEMLQQLNIMRDTQADAERRKSTLTELGRRLAHRPSPAQLQEMNVIPALGAGSAASMAAVSQPDPTIRAAGRDLMWQLQRDHLSRSLRNKPSLDELVRRNIIRLGTGGNDGLYAAYQYYHQQRQQQQQQSASDDSGTESDGGSSAAGSDTEYLVGSSGGSSSRNNVVGGSNSNSAISGSAVVSSAVRHAAPVLASLIERRPQPDELLASRPSLLQPVMMWTRLSIPPGAAPPPVALLGGTFAPFGGGMVMAGTPSAPPSPRNCHSLTLVGRKVFLCGGYEEASNTSSGSGSGSSGSSGSASTSGAAAGGGQANSSSSSGGGGGGGDATSSTSAASLAEGPASLEPVVLDLDASAWTRPPVGIARFDPAAGRFLPGPAGRYAHSAVPYKDSFIVMFGGFTSGKHAAAAAGSLPSAAASATASAGGPTWLNDVWILDTRVMPQAAALLAAGLMDPATGQLGPQPGATGTALPPGFLDGDSFATDAAASLGAYNTSVNHSASMAMGAVAMINWYVPPLTTSSAAAAGSGSSSSGGSGPAPRCAHSAALLRDSLMVVFGGNDGAGLYNDTWVLDLAPQAALVQVAAAAAPNIASGSGIASRRSLCAPPLEWRQATLVGSGRPPSPRAGHSAVAVGWDHLLVFGGGAGWGRACFNDLFLLTAHHNAATTGSSSSSGLGGVVWSWSRPAFSGAPPSPRMGHSAVLLGGDRMFIFGGGDEKRAFNDLHVLAIAPNPQPVGSPGDPDYCPFLLSWSRPADSGALPSPRWGHVAAGIGASHVVLYGGSSRDGSNYGDLHALDTQFDYYHYAVTMGSKQRKQQLASSNRGGSSGRGSSSSSNSSNSSSSVTATVQLLQSRQLAAVGQQGAGGDASGGTSAVTEHSNGLVCSPTAGDARIGSPHPPRPVPPKGVNLPDGGVAVQEEEAEEETEEEEGAEVDGAARLGSDPNDTLVGAGAIPSPTRRHTIDGSKISGISSSGGDKAPPPSATSSSPFGASPPPPPPSAAGNQPSSRSQAGALASDLTLTRRRYSWSATSSDTGMLAAALPQQAAATPGESVARGDDGRAPSVAFEAVGAALRSNAEASLQQAPSIVSANATSSSSSIEQRLGAMPAAQTVQAGTMIMKPAATSAGAALDTIRQRILEQQKQHDRQLQSVIAEMERLRQQQQAQYATLLDSVAEIERAFASP